MTPWMVNVGPQLPESPKTGMPCECGLLIVHRKVLTDDTVVRTSDDIGDLDLDASLAEVEIVCKNDCMTRVRFIL